METLLKANLTNIEWHGFSIWNVLTNDQKEELDKGRLTLIIITKASRFYYALYSMLLQLLKIENLTVENQSKLLLC